MVEAPLAMMATVSSELEPVTTRFDARPLATCAAEKVAEGATPELFCSVSRSMLVMVPRLKSNTPLALSWSVPRPPSIRSPATHSPGLTPRMSLPSSP